MGRAALLIVSLTLLACSQPRAPVPYPGERWFDSSGAEVSFDLLRLYRPGCPEWSTAGFLELRWPIGEESGEYRQYVRDPDHVLPTRRLLAPYDGRSSLSDGALYTGLHTGEFQLWAGPDSDDYLYLVKGPRVEALPRAEEPLTCD